MACHVEITNGIELNDKESAGESESDIEIMTLKHAIKEKMHDCVSVSVNGSIEGASGSSSSVNNGAVENGHVDDKPITDSEHEIDNNSRRQTPKKLAKGKQVKGKKEKKVTTSSKSKRRTPVKKPEAVADEDTTKSELSEQSSNSGELINKDVEDDVSTVDVVGELSEQSVSTIDVVGELSEQSSNSGELVNKDVEDDVSSVDVVGDNDDSAFTGENEFSTEDEDTKANSPAEKHKQDNVTIKVFSRLRESMRFSISPRKREAASSSGSSVSSSFVQEQKQHSFRGITGRRALHQTSSWHSLREAEPALQQNLKRKAQSESPEVPQRKHFITSLSEHSPGWTFFSSPFNRFWSPKKASADSTVSSSTPVRKHYEDIEDSMAVNVDETMDISSQDEDFDIENTKEKNDFKEEKSVKNENNKTAQSGWRCSIM